MEQVDQSWEACRSVLFENWVSSMAMSSEAVSNVIPYSLIVSRVNFHGV